MIKTVHRIVPPPVLEAGWIGPDVLPIGEDENPTRLYVELEFTRATVLEVSIAGLPEELISRTGRPSGVGPNVFEFDIYARFRQDHIIPGIEIQVGSNQEAVLAVAVSIERADGTYSRYSTAPGDDVYELRFQEWLPYFEPLSPSEYRATVLEQILQSGDDATRLNGRRYFFLLDTASHPWLEPLVAGGSSMNHDSFLRWLYSRLKNRVRSIRGAGGHIDSEDGEVRKPIAPMSPGTIDIDYPRITDRYAAMQEALVASVFGGNVNDDGDSPALHAYRNALIQFASGDLRLRIDDGRVTIQPRGGYFFLFAEFSLFMTRLLETGALPAPEWRVSCWQKMTEAAIAALPAFALAYPIGSGKKSPDTFRASSFNGVPEKDQIDASIPVTTGVSANHLEYALATQCMTYIYDS